MHVCILMCVARAWHVYRYDFNPLTQRRMLPEAYRPPEGTAKGGAVAG